MYHRFDVIVAIFTLLSVGMLFMALRRRRSSSYRYLLTPAERRFYRTLVSALRLSSGGLDILPQVRLAELIEPDPQVPSLYRQRMAAIAYKTVDFVVCVREQSEYRPLICIELNDSTHRRRDRIERDAVVRMACMSACIPIAFVDIRYIDDRFEVLRQIQHAIDVCETRGQRGYVARRLPIVPSDILASARHKRLRVCPFVRQVDTMVNSPKPKTHRWYSMARVSVIALCDKHWRIVDVR